MGSIAEKIYTSNGRVIDLPSGTVAYNLGAGGQKYPGVNAIDIRPGENIDLVCDLDKFPWPITESSADVVFTFHYLEHTENLLKTMEEIHRICKPGARLVAEMPYFRHVGAFQDPTHKHFFTSRTMQYFCGSLDGSYYSDKSFRLIDFWYGWPPKGKNIFAYYFRRLMRKIPKWYDAFGSIFLPVPVIIVELEVIKK